MPVNCNATQTGEIFIISTHHIDIADATYAHMKITIEISDSLLEEASKLAAKEGTTVQALVEQALRPIVAERKSRGVFKLRKASFAGNGLQLGAAGTTWGQFATLFTKDEADDYCRY